MEPQTTATVTSRYPPAGAWVVLQPGALGDVVVLLRVALRVRDIQQRGHLHLASRANPGDLSAAVPRITHTDLAELATDLPWLDGRSGHPPPERLAALVRDRYVISAFSDVGERAHQQLERLSPRRVYSIFRPQSIAERGHIVQMLQRDLERQGVEFACDPGSRFQDSQLELPAHYQAAGRARLAAAGCAEPTALIHAGASRTDKCWPRDCFVHVADDLRRRGFSACFLIGPAELTRSPDAGDQRHWNAHPVVVSRSPDELLALLCGAAVFLGNDTGPGHLAALLKRPSVTLFHCPGGDMWQPLSAHGSVITGDPQREDWGLDPEAIATLVANKLRLGA